MALLDDLVLSLRVNVADVYEQRKVATIRYKGQAGKADLEITKEHIAITLDRDTDAAIEHKILFTADKTILDMFIQFANITGVTIMLDPHTAPSYNIRSLFYTPRTTIIFGDDKDTKDIEGLDIYLNSFYSDTVYQIAVNDALHIIREGRNLEDLEEGDLVYLKWLASADLCKKRAAALIESLSKLREIDRESINLGGKISISSDTGASADIQSIARHWMDLADKYEKLCRNLLEDSSVAMPEVVLGSKVFEDNVTGATFPTQNIDMGQKVKRFASEKFGNNLVLTWEMTPGKDFKEYRIYAAKEDFYVPQEISRLADNSNVTFVATLEKVQYPEYVYENYYAEIDPPTVFYLVVVTITDRMIRSNKLEISS